MKIKAALSSTVFAICFSIGLILCAPSTTRTFTHIFKKKVNPQAQAKIYDFLLQDRQNIKVMVKNLQNRTHGDSIAFADALKIYGESAEKLDTSNLPEDFQFAWKKYSTVKREWADFVSHLKGLPDRAILNEAEIEIANEKIAEEKSIWNSVVAVVNTYGIAVDSNGNINILQN